MQIVVSGKHLDVGEALQNHAQARARKACDHLSKPPAKCKVLLDKDSRANRAEILLRYDGREFAAKAKSENDMYGAIDLAANRMRRQLDDHVGKEQSKK